MTMILMMMVTMVDIHDDGDEYDINDIVKPLPPTIVDACSNVLAENSGSKVRRRRRDVDAVEAHGDVDVCIWCWL